MQELRVKIQGTTEKSYPIYIDNEDIATLKTRLDEMTKNQKRLIVISQKVYKLYGKKLGFDNKELYILKDGEEEKNLKTFGKIIEKAIELKLSRKDVIIAVGGGVAGDMAGFVASAYMRGIDFIQVPTTLLACVDSSVGGKTAIDMPHGKNFVGAFYQPKAVFINLNFLKTLDEKQYKSGFGEVIKYAFIEKTCGANEEYNLLEILKNSVSEYETRDNEFLEKIIKICLELKSAVVSQDEKEGGLRKILNLGHTLGHALEEETKYKRYSHGYGVVLGMIFVFNYALNHNLCEKEYYETALKLIEKYSYKKDKYLFICKKNLLKLMHNDKKADNNIITLIVPTKYGEVTELHENDFCLSDLEQNL